MNNQLEEYTSIVYDGRYDQFMKSYKNIVASNRLPKDCLNQQYTSISLEQIKMDTDPKKYEINVDGVIFRCFINPKKSEHMLVFLNGATNKKDYFARSTWNHNCCTLAIADPMTTMHGLELGWYYGDKQKDYREKCSKLIKKFAKTYYINEKNTIIYGSSGGGTAAIYISHNIEGSRSVSLNPQTDITKDKNVLKLEAKMNLSVKDELLLVRNDLKKLIQEGKNKHLIIVNIDSANDCRNVAVLAKSLDFFIGYGLSKKDNLYIWTFPGSIDYNGKGGWSAHNSFDYFELFPFIDYAIKNIDSEKMCELILLVNEILRERYALKTENLCLKTILNSESNAMSAYRLSKMYSKGLYVEKDLDKSEYYLEKAANLGYKKALSELNSANNDLL